MIMRHLWVNQVDASMVSKKNNARLDTNLVCSDYYSENNKLYSRIFMIQSVHCIFIIPVKDVNHLAHRLYGLK